MHDLPKLALSIMQPWAWLIVNGHKDIENRDWLTKFRGPVAIHAGKKLDYDCAADLASGWHPVTGETVIYHKQTWDRGGIVGIADIVDCVSASPSNWFVGRYGFVIENARPVPFVPVQGALGFFDWRRNIR